ncbi:MAG: hypothetical protein IKA99_04110 [Clostridia bacterium]|nr:hypothetical protein [Clostridia bacterium]
MLELFKNKIKFKIEYAIIIILLVCVVALPFTNFTKSQTKVDATDNYVYQIEERLKKSLEKIDGVRRATVSITVAEGIKTVVAEDVKEVEEGNKKTKTSTTVLVGGKPIILGEIYPEIAGVVIICDCSDSMTVKMSVLDVVTTMLNVSCDKVRILTQ